MFSLKDFISALQAGWFVSLTVFIGSAIILGGNYYQLPYLSSPPGWLITFATAAGVFSFSVLLSNTVYIPIKIFQYIKAKKSERKKNNEIIQAVLEVTPEEGWILGYLVKTGRRAFNAEFNDRRLSPLVTKGIILKLSGTHSTLEWPYLVHEVAWDFLNKHKGDIDIELPADGRDPFNWKTF